MATSAQSTIRGLDINKTAQGFADEEIIFKKYCILSDTSAREIRWYQKTAGFLSATTPETIANVAEGALPFVLEQSWTRNTSYVKKYFVESPLLTMEDIKDCDIDVLATNIRDLTRAVAYQVDLRIWNVMTESQSASTINSVTTNAAWNAASYTGVNIVEDLMEAKQKIRSNGYDPEGAILFLNATNHKHLITWLIDGKGSSIPSFASQRISDGVVMEILGLRVVVSENVTSDYAAVMIPQRAVRWKSFAPITAITKEEPGIGTIIRVWEEGEALLEHPKAVCLIVNTDA